MALYSRILESMLDLSVTPILKMHLFVLGIPMPKEAFNKQLNTVQVRIFKNNIVIVMNNPNVKASSDYTMRERDFGDSSANGKGLGIAAT